jgi:hypothetical protein
MLKNTQYEGAMGRKCYISFKTEDSAYKEYIQKNLPIDMVDKSLDEPIQSEDEDYIMSVIRTEYLADSTVTIHLIGQYSAESRGEYEQRFIKRELQGSLYDSASNPRNGILGIVLPEAAGLVFKGQSICAQCGHSHNIVAIDQTTTVREFSYNYYIPNNKCAHGEDDRYCVLAAWSDFTAQPEAWIEAAYAKRTAPIASKVRVYP